jgi:hypothetical protein
MDYPSWGEVNRITHEGRCWFLLSRHEGRLSYEVAYVGGAVQVSCFQAVDCRLQWLQVFQPTASDRLSISRGAHMGSRFLAAAKAKAATGSERLACADPYLFKDRPAIEEFLTLLADDGGEVREASVLMVCPRADGFAVGIKDDSAGGWAWKTAATVGKALDMLDKALQAGDLRFSTSAGSKQTRRQRGA